MRNVFRDSSKSTNMGDVSLPKVRNELRFLPKESKIRRDLRWFGSGKSKYESLGRIP